MRGKEWKNRRMEEYKKINSQDPKMLASLLFFFFSSPPEARFNRLLSMTINSLSTLSRSVPFDITPIGLGPCVSLWPLRGGFS